MGAFAQKKINEILRMLRLEERIDDKDKRILKTIECIGDSLIKEKLLELYDKNQGLSNSEEKMKPSLDEQTIDIKKLLLADKQQLEGYINKFGKISRNNSKELCEKIFRYDTFSGRKSAYNILKIQNVTVCPYCNRQYIFTLGNHKVRPQFDHYYPKSIYPYLALSIFNLIPSCSICNQAKSSFDTHNCPILYPYEEEFGDEVRFRIISDDIKYIHGMTDDFDLYLQMDGVDSKKVEKVEQQNKQLHLMKLYHTREEAIAIVYMNDVRKENLGKRPLAKLTRDIYRELEIHK